MVTPQAPYRNITHKTIVRIELTLEEDVEYRNIDFRKSVMEESITPGRKLDFEKIKTLESRKETKKKVKT